MVPVHILSTSYASASVFSRFASAAAAAFSFSGCASASSLSALLALRFFLWRRFFIYFLDAMFFCLFTSFMLYHVVFSIDFL